MHGHNFLFAHCCHGVVVVAAADAGGGSGGFQRFLGWKFTLLFENTVDTNTKQHFPHPKCTFYFPCFFLKVSQMIQPQNTASL